MNEMTSSTRFLYCEKHHFPYFEDYIKTFVRQLNLNLVIVESVNLVNYNHTDTYFFLSKLPQCILLGEKIKAIYINMEQLTRECFLVYVQTIKAYNIPILNYNESNQALVPGSQLLRYQYLPEEVTALSSPIEKVYDVAFVGSPSPKRKLILNQLEAVGIRVIIVEGWREKRDQEILKAKILLNIHYDNEYNIYESIRCDRFIFSGMLVVTENSIYQDSLDIKELFISVQYDQLVSKVQEILSNYPSYLERFNLAKERFLPEIIQSRSNDLIIPRQL